MVDVTMKGLEGTYAALQNSVATATKAKTAIDNKWTDLLVDAAFNATSAVLDYAMFRGSTPVDLTTFIDDHIDAFTYGTSGQKEKLILIELDELKKYPAEYAAWLASNKGSTKWGGGARTYINDILGSAGTIKDAYSYELQKLNIAKKLYTSNAAPVTESNKKTVFQKELLAALGAKKAVDFPQSAFYGVHIVDSNGSGIQLLIGKMSAFPALEKDGASGFVFKKSPSDPVEFDVDLLRPSSIETFVRNPSSNVPTETAIEHHLATATQTTRGKYFQLIQLKRIAKRKQDKDVIAYLDTIIPVVKRLVDAAKSTDKVFFDPTVKSTQKTLDTGQYKTFSDAYDAAIKSQASKLADTEIMILEELDTGILTTGNVAGATKIQLPFRISGRIFSISGKAQNSNIKAARNKLILGLLEEILKNPSEPAMLQKLGRIGSSSALTGLFLIELSKIFPVNGKPNKEILALIEPQKGPKVVKKYRIKAEKPHKKIDSDKAKKLAEKNLKNLQAFARDAKAGVQRSLNHNKSAAARSRGSLRLSSGKGPAQFNSIELVSTLNRYIGDAVRQQMVSPSLINRTGKFANSVRIDSVNELMIKYSYQKNPYAVFSTRSGLGPWNSVRARDPGTIIKKAILSIGANKYGAYFKNNPNVSET